MFQFSCAYFIRTHLELELTQCPRMQYGYVTQMCLHLRKLLWINTSEREFAMTLHLQFLSFEVYAALTGRRQVPVSAVTSTLLAVLMAAEPPANAGIAPR